MQLQRYSQVDRGESPTVDAHCLGHIRAKQPGPTIIVTGAIHGNEPAGREALVRVLGKLRGGHGLVRGQLFALAGNLRAFEQGRRFLQRDLNRNWNREYVDRLATADVDSLRAEDAEQRELLCQFSRILGEIREPEIESEIKPAVFLDLHTSSGPGQPFVCMADILRNRKLAFAFKLPVVLGLEEAIEGSMLGYLCDHGHCGIAVEGGSHTDPSSVTCLESVIWTTLANMGLIMPDHAEVASSRQHLRELSRGVPPVIEIAHRHEVVKDDGFDMQPGFSSFQPITKGQVLATDMQGDIVAPESGLMLLPRYQPQGDDGFFVARAVAPQWLRLSGWLRRSRCDTMMRWLPGVILDTEHPDRLFVDSAVARFKMTELFHLFGYRKTSPSRGRHVFIRRRPDYFGTQPLGFSVTEARGQKQLAPND